MTTADSKAVDVGQLGLQELLQVQKQLQVELEHYQDSGMKLATYKQQALESIQSIETIANEKQGKEILVPLTSSLYVDGTLADPGRVLVNIGTGYFVEKSAKDAQRIFMAKTKTIDAGQEDLNKILQVKMSNYQTICRLAQEKMRQEQEQQGEEL
jgi:prefoldin alpha subunit